MQAGGSSLPVCLWQRITWPGSNTSPLLSVPLLTPPEGRGHGLSQDKPLKHCAFHMWHDVIQRWKIDYVSACVCMSVCDLGCHTASVSLCVRRGLSTMSTTAHWVSVSLLSRCPESKMQAGTEGLSHITLLSSYKKLGAWRQIHTSEHTHILGLVPAKTQDRSWPHTHQSVMIVGNFWSSNKWQFCYKTHPFGCSLFHILNLVFAAPDALCVTLKGHCTDFTHQSEFTCHEEHFWFSTFTNNTCITKRQCYK